MIKPKVIVLTAKFDKNVFAFLYALRKQMVKNLKRQHQTWLAILLCQFLLQKLFIYSFIHLFIINSSINSYWALPWARHLSRPCGFVSEETDICCGVGPWRLCSSRSPFVCLPQSMGWHIPSSQNLAQSFHFQTWIKSGFEYQYQVAGSTLTISFTSLILAACS